MKKGSIAFAVAAAIVALLVAWAGGFIQGSGRCSMERAVETATLFDAGKTTFCEMDEDARMAACPALRLFMPLADGGGAFVYQCRPDDRQAYVEFIGIAPSKQDALLSQWRSRGLNPVFHCSDSAAAIYRISGGGFSAAR